MNENTQPKEFQRNSQEKLTIVMNYNKKCLSQLPPVVHKVRGKASQAASQAPNICIL
jgi:hypothetical protein